MPSPEIERYSDEIAESAQVTAVGPAQPRKIIHIDMDAFYASVEQRDNPALRGKPLAVGGSRQRGVVAAASYEARRFGVHSAMPSVTAKRLCPDLIFVSPRFEVYRTVSHQVREIFAEFTTRVEPLSLDEAYLDVTENRKCISSATEIAEQIRARIRAETALTASAGVSYNKFLAKMASSQKKPDGLFVITPSMGAAFVERLPIGRFHGIGPATTVKMQRLGITSGAELKAQSLPFLEENFGKVGRFYYWIARGIDDRQVCADRIRKSIGAENTFMSDLFTIEEARAALEPLLDKVWHYCEAGTTCGRTVTLKAKFSDFKQITRSRTAQTPFTTRAALEETAHGMLDALFPPRKGIRLLGITLSALGERSGRFEEQLRLRI